MRMRRFGWVMVVTVLLASADGWAQTAEVGGRVVTASGEGLPGVLVEATADSGLRATTVSGDDGSYRLTGLRPGRHHIVASLPGFAPGTDVFIDVDGVVARDLTMALSTGETVQVLSERTRVATKAEAPILELPQSVALVPAQVLADQLARDLPDATRNVSGVVHSSKNRGADDEYSLRGFYSDSSGNFRRNGVEVNKFDDLLNANAERVEVLKGPSSVLYGRLDPGGVINVVTKQPLAVRFTQLELRGGQFATADARLDTTGPLSDSRRWLYRVNASAERRGSFRDDVRFDKQFVAPAVTALLGSNSRLTVELEGKRDEGVSDSGLVAATASFAALDAVPIERFVFEPDARFARRHVAGLATYEAFAGTAWQFRATANYGTYERNPHDITPGAVGADGRTLARAADFRDQTRRFGLAEAQVLGRAATGAVSHEFVIGATRQDIDLDEERRRGNAAPIDLLAPRPTGLPTGLALTADAEQRIALNGLFVQERLGVGRLRLQAGIRYSDLEQRDDNLLASSSRVLEAEAWNPQVGAVLLLAPWLSAYGSYSSSFTPITFVGADGTTYDPSEGNQYEGGVKMELFERRLAVTTAAYRLSNRNLLSFFVNPSTGLFEVAQGGLHRTTGVELDMNGRLGAHWALVGHYTYMHGRVIEDPAFRPGRLIGGAPRYSASAWLSYRRDRWTAGAGLFARDRMKAFTSSDALLPEYTVTDAMAGWQATSAMHLQINVKNVFDRRYYITGAGANVGYPGAPRTLQGQVSYRF